MKCEECKFFVKFFKNFYFFIKTIKTEEFFAKKEPWKVPEFLLDTIFIDSKYHQDILRVEYHLEEWRYCDSVR